MITQILKSRLVQFILVGALSVGVWNHFHPQINTTKILKDIQTVTVEKPVLVSRDVNKIITDPNQKVLINKLLKQNDALNLQVIQLINATATNESHGGTDSGGIVTIPPTTLTPNETPQPYTFSYKDYQLTANYNEPNFTYDLKQDFIIQSSTGKAKDGSKLSILKLYQVTPSGNVDIPVKATVIFADEQASRWMVSPRIQGGLGVNQDGKAGIIAVQWLKRGRSKSAEDTSFSVLTPEVSIGSTTTIGILPVSFNIGTLPHQPFTNLWISPSIDINKKVGVVLSATF